MNVVITTIRIGLLLKTAYIQSNFCKKRNHIMHITQRNNGLLFDKNTQRRSIQLRNGYESLRPRILF